MAKSNKTSIVDVLYYRLFGKHQSKEGQALERLSAIAFKILEDQRKVQYDLQMKAKYSNTTYQIDGLLSDADNQTMVEAKDYTVRDKKVGRADLQKLEGALTDLDIKEGRFVSATDYTNRAKPYAESTKVNPKQNPIELYHVRPSDSTDIQGRLKTIVVNLTVHGLEFESGKYAPVFNKKDFERIKHLIPQNGERIKMTLHLFYDINGEICETFENLTRKLNSHLPSEIEKGYILKGEWLFERPTYLEIHPFWKLRVDSLKYEIPTYSEEMSFTVNQEGEPVLLVRSEDGKIDKLLTDEQLKSFKFDNGQVSPK